MEYLKDPTFPEDILVKITDDFLTTFKTELEKTFPTQFTDIETPTYWNFYQWLDSTCGFYGALKASCELHNFIELYDYLQSLEWFDSDILDGSLTEMLYKRGLVEAGNVNELYA
jgi:hypothetical protein